MKLQVALDFGTREELKEILRDIVEYVDIVEIGAIVNEYGLQILEELKREFPGPEYLADLKIADGGYYFAKRAHEVGASYVTVLAVTEDETIKGCVQAARELGIKVVVDMLGVKNFMERIRELDSFGVDYISIHTPADLQAVQTPFENLRFASMLVKNAKLSVAGGVNPDNVAKVLPYHPEIVIVGSALAGKDRVATAKALRKALDSNQ